jgi:hypothetical protein
MIMMIKSPLKLVTLSALAGLGLSIGCLDAQSSSSSSPASCNPGNSECTACWNNCKNSQYRQFQPYVTQCQTSCVNAQATSSFAKAGVNNPNIQSYGACLWSCNGTPADQGWRSLTGGTTQKQVSAICPTCITSCTKALQNSQNQGVWASAGIFSSDVEQCLCKNNFRCVGCNSNYTCPSN